MLVNSKGSPVTVISCPSFETWSSEGPTVPTPPEEAAPQTSVDPLLFNTWSLLPNGRGEYSEPLKTNTEPMPLDGRLVVIGIKAPIATA